MKHSLKTGFSFGLTSGVITTLGLIVGLHAGTHAKIAVVGGILTIAVADAFSDALGIHIAEESEGKHTAKEIWESTIATFLAKLVVASTFLLPVLLLSLNLAIIISVIWGFLLLGVFSFYLGKEQKENVFKIIGEHLFIAVLVIIIAQMLGSLISAVFS